MNTSLNKKTRVASIVLLVIGIVACVAMLPVVAITATAPNSLIAYYIADLLGGGPGGLAYPLVCAVCYVVFGAAMLHFSAKPGKGKAIKTAGIAFLAIYLITTIVSLLVFPTPVTLAIIAGLAIAVVCGVIFVLAASSHEKTVLKNPRRKIYVKVNQEKGEVVYSGIDFAEFIRYSRRPIENLMIIAGGGLFESKSERGVELVEGNEFVQRLTKENIYNLGNFCFVDYNSPGSPEELSDAQIAELLYMGRMFEPSPSPFFEELQNRFVYLSHDDGWYCKLYCKDIGDFAPVLCGKIAASINRALLPSLDKFGHELLQLASDGIFIDLDEIYCKEGRICIKAYSVGELPNMDIIINSLAEVKKTARYATLEADFDVTSL